MLKRKKQRRNDHKRPRIYVLFPCPCSLFRIPRQNRKGATRTFYRSVETPSPNACVNHETSHAVACGTQSICQRHTSRTVILVQGFEHGLRDRRELCINSMLGRAEFQKIPLGSTHAGSCQLRTVILVNLLERGEVHVQPKLTVE